MQHISLSLVLRRSRSGQSVSWGTGALPELHERLLMRLNGYTTLEDLLHESESPEQMLGAVAALLERGLVEPIEEQDDPHWPCSRFDQSAVHPVGAELI
jgi:hypothetical protein